MAPLPELFTGGMLGLVLLAAADGVCEGEFVGGSVLGGGLLGEAVVAVVAGVGVAEVGAGDGETLDDDGAGVGPVVAEVGVGVGLGARQPGAGDWPSGAAGDAETGPGGLGVPDALTTVPPEAEPAPPGAEAGAGQAGWVNVLPGRDDGGALPAPAAPRWAELPACVPLRLFVFPTAEPEPPRVALGPGRTSSPPVKTVELTWTSAVRSGGTATAIAVSEAAAARPPTRRAQPSRVGRAAGASVTARRCQVIRRKFSGRVAHAQ